MKKQIVTMAALACVIATAAGCGKTNPKEDYPELADSVLRDPNKPVPTPPPEPVIPQTVKEEPKSYLDSALFQIEVANNLNFVEGKESSYLVKPTSLIANATFKLVASEKPEGVTFAPVKANEPMGAYKLTWKPAVGTLVNQESYRAFDFVVAVEVTGGSDQAAVERLKRIAVPKEDVKIQLFRTSEQPKIKQNDLKTRNITEIPEGEKIAFTVTVEDKGAYAGHPPRLFADDEEIRNSDFAFVPGRRYVSIARKPSDKGNGVYVFNVIFDSRGIEIPSGKKNVLARFTVVAQSPSGLVTPDEAIEIKVVKKEVAPPVEAEKPAPPVANPPEEKPVTVTADAQEVKSAIAPEAVVEKPAASTDSADAKPASEASSAPSAAAAKSEATTKTTTTKPAAKSTVKATAKPVAKPAATKKPVTTATKAKTTTKKPAATAQGDKK